MNDRLRFDIHEHLAFADGVSFGDVGPYERLTGEVRFRVDPSAPDVANVVDIDKAPVDEQGKVEFSADLCILRPVDWSRGSRSLLFGYGNRGNKRELQFFNDAPASNRPLSLAHAGNGYLMRRGHAVVWGAWQGDLLPGNGRMTMRLPVATRSGAPLTGLVRTEFIVEKPGTFSTPLSGRASTRSHPTISMDPAEARLTRRRYADDPRQLVAPTQWAFAREEFGAGLDAQGAERAVVPSATHLHIPAGFEPGWIYELVYTARDPLVMGLGHVAVRDLVSFLRHDTHDAAGTDNPLGPVEHTFAWGRSQTGRCIRDFVHLGFNEDVRSRRVFDGIAPHVSGAGLMWLNHRFANGVNPAGQQYEDHFNCADHFPFSYASSTDHLTGRSDAILKRPQTDPKVLHTQTATEYWQRRGSLVHTDTQGNDLAQPENVRVYLWSSSEHFSDPNLREPKRGVCVHYGNIVQTSMLFRAMLDALYSWVRDGVEPPASRIPLRSDGTLVDAGHWRDGFPVIPGALLPSGPNPFPLLDFGPEFEAGILGHEPPRIVDAEGYRIGVPAVDGDGNDIAGVRAPMVQAPLGTYTGWNIRGRGHGYGTMFEFSGSYLPFADTPEERTATRDPRASVLERYADEESYLEAIRAGAQQLVAQRLMIAEDIDRSVARARDWGRPLHDVRLAPGERAAR